MCQDTRYRSQWFGVVCSLTAICTILFLVSTSCFAVSNHSQETATLANCLILSSHLDNQSCGNEICYQPHWNVEINGLYRGWILYPVTLNYNIAVSVLNHYSNGTYSCYYWRTDDQLIVDWTPSFLDLDFWGLIALISGVLSVILGVSALALRFRYSRY